MIKKKLVKEWGKIKLLETSAVGIPAYPDAHKSHSNSLVKVLAEAEDQLNYGESPMEEDKSKDESESKEVSETEAEAPAEPETETKEEEVAETTETEAVEDKKGMSKEDMMDMMTKGFQAAIEASKTPRGLVSLEVDKAEQMQEKVKSMSLGELAIMNGIAKRPDMYGKVN